MSSLTGRGERFPASIRGALWVSQIWAEFDTICVKKGACSLEFLERAVALLKPPQNIWVWLQ